jgi:D-serine deaminase-like pyridoxal phosphate-dependent protein
LILDLDALERNINHMAEFCRQHNIGLRPHAKTHKSINIARLQIQAGALGVCTATLGEAEVMAGGDIANVLITTPVVGELKIARLLDLNRVADGLSVVVDDAQNLARLAQAAQVAGQTLHVVVAVDVGSRRVGTPDLEQAVALAKQIEQATHLTFGGVHAYAGFVQHIQDYQERTAQATVVNHTLAGLKQSLIEADLAPPIVSGSGTGSHEIDAQAGVFTELQAGSYVFTDVEYNVVPLRRADKRPFASSLFVQTRVVSANHDGFVTTDGGTKRFATGGAPPEVVSGAPPGTIYSFRGDEHGKLAFADPDFRLSLGSVVELLPPHCDPTVNLHEVYHVVRGDTLVDIWPVDARGVI